MSAPPAEPDSKTEADQEPEADPRIEKLLEALSLEEKVSMMTGSGMWHSTGVPRLKIPRLKVTDGPNGARGESHEGATSACFPCGTALAASWNVELIRAVGAEIGAEVKSKGAHILLGPTVNIHRAPLAGRNFECYSEDPHLTARIAAATCGAYRGGATTNAPCGKSMFIAANGVNTASPVNGAAKTDAQPSK